MSEKKLTTETIKSIVDMRKKGIQIKQISSHFSVSVGLVYQALHKSKSFNLIKKFTCNSNHVGSDIDMNLTLKRAKKCIQYKHCAHDECRALIPSTDVACHKHYHLMLTGEEPSAEYHNNYMDLIL